MEEWLKDIDSEIASVNNVVEAIDLLIDFDKECNALRIKILEKAESVAKTAEELAQVGGNFTSELTHKKKIYQKVLEHFKSENSNDAYHCLDWICGDNYIDIEYKNNFIKNAFDFSNDRERYSVFLEISVNFELHEAIDYIFKKILTDSSDIGLMCNSSVLLLSYDKEKSKSILLKAFEISKKNNNLEELISISENFAKIENINEPLTDILKFSLLVASGPEELSMVACKIYELTEHKKWALEILFNSIGMAKPKDKIKLIDGTYTNIRPNTLGKEGDFEIIYREGSFKKITWQWDLYDDSPSRQGSQKSDFSEFIELFKSTSPMYFHDSIY